MKTILAFLTMSILSLAMVRAEDAPATSATPTPIELKNKSSFTMDASGRNPFWPIGWKPVVRTQTSTTEHTGPDILPTAFVVSSITLDQGAKYAIINGKVMAEGQVFGLQLGNQTYQLTVKAIEDGRVILARRDQEIIVPLRRK
jgi:hypothetical protein